MEVVNAKARAFAEQADAILAELADPAKEFTPDEIQARVKNVEALKARAAAVGSITADDVAEQRGLVKVDPANAPDEGGPTLAEAQAAVIKEFQGVGRYMLAVAGKRTMTERQRTAVERLRNHPEVRVMVGTAADGSGGEYLLPLTQAPDIFIGTGIVQPGLFERARRYAMPGRTVRIPYLIQDADTDTRPLSGIAATTIVGEGSEKPEKEPSIGQRTLTGYKWAAYTETSDELLDDDHTGQLPSVLQQAIGGDLLNSINQSVTITGSGSSAPLGALHTSNGALITVNRDTSQQVKPADVFAMLSKSTMGPRAFWLAHISTIPQLMAMELSSGSQVTWTPNLREGAPAMLLGKPLVFTHLTSVLGVAGDLALIDPDHYAVALRQAVTVESSIHYKFRNDVTAWRFYARAGGIPIPTDTYSFAGSGSAKTYSFSPFVRLGDDATS